MNLLSATLTLAFTFCLVADENIFDTKSADGIVIPLGVESGSPNDRGRDTRVFTIPASCLGEKGNFTWSGSGQTVITAAYAKKLNTKIADNEDLKAFMGADGKPLFL